MPTPMDNGYKMVAERHAQFVIDCPNGVINTELSYATSNEGVGLVIVKASIWKVRPESDWSLPDGTGMASMPIPGVTNFTRNSEVENAETSAIGRALAAIGYHAKDTMASDDEIAMKKGDAPTRRKAAPAAADEEEPAPVDPMRAQRAMLMNWGKKVLGSREEFLTFLNEEFNVKAGKDITPEMVDDIKKMLAIKAAEQGKPAVPEGVTFDA